MKLPNANQAIILPEKITEYLLSPTHPIGRLKAQWFSRLGYNLDSAQILEEELRNMTKLDAELAEESKYGQKYRIVGPITGPTGEIGVVVSIWIVRTGDTIPRFVTAYPGEQT